MNHSKRDVERFGGIHITPATKTKPEQIFARPTPMFRKFLNEAALLTGSITEKEFEKREKVNDRRIKNWLKHLSKKGGK